MQIYGKTLKHDRFFPIFYNFAAKINIAMKYYEVNFRIEAPAETFDDVRFVVTALAGEAALEAFTDTDEGMVGYVQQALFDRSLLDEQMSQLPFEDVRVTYEVAEAEDKDWNETWEQEGFEPIIINNKVVVHDGRHLADTTLLPDAVSIEIDTRQAFGTGNHETTRLMISHLLQMPLEGRTVLDCGTGTGILGIAALKLGAARATGYDIDEWSADNARHNAVINRVDDRFTSLLGNAQQVIPTIQPQCFDVVMANINRNILLADMPLFVSCMKPGATLLLSGFYPQDLPMLEQKGAELSLHLTAEASEGDWQSCRLEL